MSIFIVAAKRTPFGAFGGSLKTLSATDLGVAASKAALSGIDPELVDQVVFGNVLQTHQDSAYLARHVGLLAGCKTDTPSLTLNRLCGSGFETVMQACRLIKSKEASIVLAGGTEQMSCAPFSADGMLRWSGPKLGSNMQLRDVLWDGLTDALSGTPMGVTAENLAKDYNISRQECDEFAVRSQNLWQEANRQGIFKHEIAPVDIVTKKKTTTVDTDEHPRDGVTVESLGRLPPVFAKDGVVTAANSSGICDGAGAILVASEEAVIQHNLTPLARIVGYGVAGCEPTRMGIGPVPAIKKALAHAQIDSIDAIDRFEINEAFCAQFLAVAKELGLDMDKCNLHGGATSIGHPLAASGSRILAHLAHEYSYNTTKLHLGAACIGGGQGIAVILERA
jgi:acetyl-CoA acyltransferase 2